VTTFCGCRNPHKVTKTHGFRILTLAVLKWSDGYMWLMLNCFHFIFLHSY